MDTLALNITGKGKMGAQLSKSADAVEKAYQSVLAATDGPLASADPAGSVISERLEAQISELHQRIKNTELAIAKFDTADSYLGELRRLTIQIREHAITALNSATLDPQSAQALQEEMNRLVESYNRILEQAEYNGARLFDGSERAVADIPSLSALDLSSPSAIEASIATLESAERKLDTIRVNLGSTVKNELQSSKNSMQIALENLSAAQSQISVDLATAMTEFIRALRRAQIEATLQAHAGLNSTVLYDLLRPPE